MTRKSLFVAAAVAMALSAPVPALAQEELPPATAGEAGAAAAVSDAEVTQFVAALDSVDAIMTGFAESAQGMDEQQQAAAQAEVQTQLVQAVEAEGLTVDRYNQIAMAAQADPDLGARIAASQQ